tara:strand:+ start:329 stop:1045 length:717 start_codon:yes stop_codon:yes gene_type:complete
MGQVYNRFTTSTKNRAAGKHKDRPLTVIIPAAGMGHRMKSYGPKCLLPANIKETILDKSIKTIKKVYNYCEIILVVGFEAEKITQTLPKEIRIVENQIYEKTSVSESVRLAINNSVYNDILIIYGDLIFNINTINELTEHGSCVVVDSKSRFKAEEIGVTIVDGKVTNFAYGLENKWSHIAYLTGNESLEFQRLCSDKKKNKMYPFEVFNIMLSHGFDLSAIEPKGMKIKEIDSLKDL